MRQGIDFNALYKVSEAEKKTYPLISIYNNYTINNSDASFQPYSTVFFTFIFSDFTEYIFAYYVNVITDLAALLVGVAQLNLIAMDVGADDPILMSGSFVPCKGA